MNTFLLSEAAFEESQFSLSDQLVAALEIHTSRIYLHAGRLTWMYSLSLNLMDVHDIFQHMCQKRMMEYVLKAAVDEARSGNLNVRYCKFDYCKILHFFIA
jgi:hypothetical protein